MFDFLRKKPTLRNGVPVFEIKHRHTGEVLLTVETDTLEKLVLDGVNLRGADLRRANLYYCSLSNANLREADLRGANLFAADLRNADLRDADMRGAKMDKANLRYIRYNSRTRFPWFFDLQKAMRR